MLYDDRVGLDIRPTKNFWVCKPFFAVLRYRAALPWVWILLSAEHHPGHKDWISIWFYPWILWGVQLILASASPKPLSYPTMVGHGQIISSCSRYFRRISDLARPKGFLDAGDIAGINYGNFSTRNSKVSEIRWQWGDTAYVHNYTQDELLRLQFKMMLEY